MIKDVIAFVDSANEVHIRQTIAQAELWGARLTLAILSPAPVMDLMTPGGMPVGLMYGSVREELDRIARERADHVRAIVGTAPVEVREISGETGLIADQAAVQARYSDFAIFGPASAYDAAWLRRSAIEAVLFDSGRPALLLPEGHTPQPAWTRAVVGWNATREANHALHEALHWLAPAANVDIAVIDPDPSLRGHGSEPGCDIATHISRHGFQADAHVLASAGRSVEETLQTFARDRAADLLVLGAYSHARLRQMVLGGTTRSVLGSCSLPTLLAY